MPEFLPTPQMPTGLAEETLRLAQARGEANPWVALAQSVGKIGNTAGQAVLDKRKMITPEQQVAMGLTAPAPGPSQPGQPGPRMSMPAFNKGMPMSLAENMLQRKTQEDMSRETTTRVMGAQGLKDKEKLTEDMVPLTPETRATLKKRGIVLPDTLDSVHRSLLTSEIKPASPALGLRDEQFWEKQWVDTGKEMNVSKATSRQPLGIAVTNNQKAGRAVKLLDKKGPFTPQDSSLITTDLTAMMKGGSPDEELLRQQQYPSLYKSAIELVQKLTASPKDLNTPEVKEHLRQVIKGIVEVDNQVIRDHVDNIESQRADVIAKRPKDWEALKSKTLKHVLEDGENGTSAHDALIDKYLGGG